jgi:hypothetical protein
MDSAELKPWQARIICAAVGKALGYLSRLRARMDRRGFPPDDKLCRLTAAAYDAVHALSIELHYRSCDGGVGRSETKREE